MAPNRPVDRSSVAAPDHCRGTLRRAPRRCVGVLVAPQHADQPDLQPGFRPADHHRHRSARARTCRPPPSGDVGGLQRHRPRADRAAPCDVRQLVCGGEYVITDVDFPLSDQTRERLGQLLRQAGLDPVDEDAVINDESPTPDQTVRISVLADNREWLALAYTVLSGCLHTVRLVIARWSPLLNASDESVSLLAELGRQAEELSNLYSMSSCCRSCANARTRSPTRRRPRSRPTLDAGLRQRHRAGRGIDPPGWGTRARLDQPRPTPPASHRRRRPRPPRPDTRRAAARRPVTTGGGVTGVRVPEARVRTPR